METTDQSTTTTTAPDTAEDKAAAAAESRARVQKQLEDAVAKAQDALPEGSTVHVWKNAITGQGNTVAVIFNSQTIIVGNAKTSPETTAVLNGFAEGIEFQKVLASIEG